MPTRLFTKSSGWVTRIVKFPNARRRMRPSWVSLKATGSRVPQRMLVKTFRLTKYTSARKGLVKPHGRESSRVRIGRFWVERVWRPGPKTSSPWPSRKKTAAWFSRTMSCAPILMSPEPPSG